jgi:ATP-binding cassette subfamily B (MDR/TAP) protein 1
MSSPKDEAPSDEEKESSPDSLEKDVGDGDSKKDEEKPPDPLASLGEVLSFAQTRNTKVILACGMFCAAVTGFTFPALAWVFSDSFERLSGSAVEGFDFMGQMRELAFQLMALGVIVAVFMTLSAGLLETAADDMAEAMKTQWFEALLRQDMAYYDITDVSGTATIININGKKYKK